LNLPKAPRWLREILYGALKHGPHTNAVSRGVVMESYRDLD
jgi:hypothetical protein